MSQNIPKTEFLYTKSKPIDHLSIFDGISLMVEEQKRAALDVKKASKSIEFAISSFIATVKGMPSLPRSAHHFAPIGGSNIATSYPSIISIVLSY